MGKRGPKPKSVDQKRLEGNPGKRKLSKPAEEGQIAITENIAPPCFMRSDKVASAEWRRLMKALISRRILTESNLKALEAYCINYSIFRNAQKELETDGPTFQTDKGYIGQHPSISIIKGSQAEMRAWWKILNESKPIKESKKKSKFAGLRSIK